MSKFRTLSFFMIFEILNINTANSKYENLVEPVITWFYSNYLKANDQPLGKETYSQVVAFLIAYQRKFGVERL